MHRRLRVGAKGADAPPPQLAKEFEQRKYFGAFLILIFKMYTFACETVYKYVQN